MNNENMKDNFYLSVISRNLWDDLQGKYDEDTVRDLREEVEQELREELGDMQYLDFLKERALEREELMSEDYVF